jgi:hypothetical protein
MRLAIEALRRRRNRRINNHAFIAEVDRAIALLEAAPVLLELVRAVKERRELTEHERALALRDPDEDDRPLRWRRLERAGTRAEAAIDAALEHPLVQKLIAEGE